MTNRALLTLVATLASATYVQAGDPPPGGTVAYPRVGQEAWRGDCDGDRDADIIDALLAARTAAGIIDIGTPISRGGTCAGTEAECEAILRGCDTDDSGRIDVVDSLQIAQMDVGIIPQGIEATLINVVPHSPDPSGAAAGITDPNPINSAAPPNPFIGAVCLYYYLTAAPASPATADVILEYSTQGGATGTWFPATVAFGGGTTSPGTPHGTMPNVVRGVPTDSMSPAAVKAIVWDSVTDIALSTQLAGSLPSVVLRLTSTDDVDAPVIPGNLERTSPFPLGNEPPACQITTPSPGTTVGGDVPVEYQLWDDDLVTFPWPVPPYPATDYTTATIVPEYSIDGGLTWQLATEGAGSGGTTGLAMGPSQIQASSQTFVWDSIADLPGLNLPVDFRISPNHDVDVFTGPVTATPDIATGNTCSVPLQLVNNTPPACTIVAPVSMQLIGDVFLIDFTILDSASDPLDIYWEYSLDGGTTWSLITVTGGGTLNSNPAIAVPATPMPTAHTINWDSSADIMGAANPVLLRVTLDDRGPGTDPQCQVDVQVDNTPTCANMGPVTSPQGGVIPMRWDTTDPDMGPLDLTLRYSTDAGMTFSECTVVNTVAPPIFDTNPALSVLPGIGQGMDWDSEADGLTNNPGTIVELEVTDGVTVVTCSVTFDVLNNVPPVCSNLTAAPADPLGQILFDFATSDLNPGDMLVVTVEYSTDFGVSYSLCMPAGASPIPGNPSAPRPTSVFPATTPEQFLWDANADIPGAAGALIRLTLTDVGGLDSMPPCTVQIFVDNRPECRAPAPMVNPDPVSGDYTFTMDILDLSSDAVTLTWEYSVDAGFSFVPMTPAPPSMNPTAGVPTTDVFAPFLFDWQSASDIPGIMLDVILRMSVDDGTTVVSCDIERDVDNTPKCTITSPMTAALVAGDVPIVFDVVSPSGNMVIGDFDFSINGGLTFSPATDAGTGTLTGNPTAPFAAGLGLDWTWQSWADVPGSIQAVVLRMTVSDAVTGVSSTCELIVDVDNIPTCAITAPAGGTLVAGDTAMAFTTTSPSGNPVDLIFEYSINSGVTYLPSTEGAPPGTVTGNPSVGNPAGAADWTWDSDGDIPGAAMSVIFRVTTQDSLTGVSSTCDVVLDVDNTPTCAITGTMPASPAFGDTSVLFDTTSPSGNMVTVAFDFSIDGGVTFNAATDAGTGTVTGNPSAPFAAAAGLDWTWMTATDIPGSVPGVILEITITDAVTGEQSVCRFVLDVSNAPSCMLTTPAAGSLISGDTPMVFTTMNPSGNPVDLAFEYSTDSGVSYNLATEGAPPGTVTGNPSAGNPAGASDWTWDTDGDIPGAATSVVFRITVTDSVTGSSATCSVAVDVDNTPTCGITGTVPGSPVFGDTGVLFDTASPSGNMVTVAFDYSINSGVSFLPATDAGTGAVTGNPSAPIAAGAGQDWTWMTASDIPGSAMGVIMQITVTDAVTGEQSTCQIVLDVANAPSCAITAPTLGQLLSGDTSMMFTTVNPSGNPVDLAFEYSINSGVTYISATEGAPPGTVTGNPSAGNPPGAGDWAWDTDGDIPGMAASVVFRVTVTDSVTGASATCDVIVDVDNAPTCNITGTMPASPVFGDTSVLFDTMSPSGNMVTVALDYSINSGVTYSPATDAGTGTVTGNPSAPFAAGAGLDWTWMTASDIPGSAMGVILRMTVSDAVTGQQTTCQFVLDVTNAPACVITAPGGGLLSGDATITFDAMSPSGNMLTADLDFSIDTGATFNPATDATTGGLTGNPTAPFAAAAGLTWDWSSASDIPTTATSVIFRITVTDSVTGATSVCQVVVDVDNLPTCGINLPAPGALEGGDAIIDLTTVSPAAGANFFAGLSLAFEVSLDSGGSFLPMTDSATGFLTGNPAPQATPGVDTWGWDSLVDVPGAVSNVIVRVTVTDVAFGGTSTCLRTFDVDNRPACVINAPAGGMQSSVVTIDFDSMTLAGDSPSFADLVATLEYSIDAGLTFQPATDASTGSVMGNPTAPYVPGNQTWDWDSALDVPGLETVLFRVTVQDMTGGASSTCTTVFDVDNGPSCLITGTMPASPVFGDTSILFDTTSLSGNMLIMSFAFSVDAGVTFNGATEGAPGTVTGNPTAPLAAGAGQDWTWDTSTDVVGGGMGVIFEVTVTDALTAAQSTCQIVVDVANVPSCTILPFMGPQSGNVAVQIDGVDPLMVGVTALFEYSTDGGVTYNLATEGAPPGAITGNPTGSFLGLQDWTWDTQADGIGDLLSVIIRATVDNGVTIGQCMQSLDIVNSPTCAINLPMAGSPESGVVTIDFTGTDPSMDMLTAALAYSVDAGVTFQMPTEAAPPGSVTGNPTGMFASGAAQTWNWDSSIDIPAGAMGVIFQLTVDDGFGNSSMCQVVFDVISGPSCVITPFMGPQSGNVTVGIDVTDPLMVGATVFFEFSTDSGVTYNTATEGAPPGLITGSPTAPTMGVQSWTWDTQADGIGDQASVIVRATVDNGASAAQCSASINILNVPACVINAPAGGSTQSGIVSINFTGTDPSLDMLTAALAYSLDGGLTFLVPTDAGTGSVTGNPTGMFAAAAAQTWDWDSAADIPAGALGVLFELTVDDGFGNTSMCQVVFDVISGPSCVITPFMGPQSGNVTVDIDVTDPLLIGATVFFEYSSDAGVTFNAATEGAPPGTITGSPTAPTLGMQDWTWDTPADGIGNLTSVIIRATVDNGASTATCQQPLDINNLVTCLITAPMGGTLVSGATLMSFDVVSPTGNLVTALFEFSDDFGLTYNLATDAGAGTLTGNPTAPYAPVLATWEWDTAADVPVGATDVEFRITVTDTVTMLTTECVVVVDVDNNSPPTCVINSPAAAAVVGGIITVDFDAADPDAGAVLTVTFEYTTDGGVTYLPMSAAGGSPLGNPAAGVLPAAGLIFDWDSVADLPPTGGAPVITDLRITVDDGLGAPSTCVQGPLTVDNEPSCIINAPMGTSEFGDVTIDFDVASLSGNPLNASFEYSTDAGATFLAATPATGLNPRTLAAGAGQIYTWDSLADFAINILGVMFRITVEDGVVASTCTTTFDVMNDVVPTCSITMPAPGALVGGIVPVVFDTVAPTGNMLTADLEFSVDAGVTFLPATDAGGGTLMGNPTAPFAAGAGLDWNWNSAVDVPGGASSVIFRITVTDSVVLVSSICNVVVDVDNAPTCANVTAAPSPAAADTLMSFDTTSPSGNMQTATLEYSLDGGLTFVPATDSGGGVLTGNPTAPFAGGAGQSWTWMTASDIPGDAFGVVFRVTITDDVTLQASTCQLVLDVLNAPSCVITPPMGLVSGDVLMAFTTTNPTGNPVDLAFDYSLNGGLSFTAAVEGAVPGTVTGNPAAGVAAGAGDWSWDTAAAVPGALASVVFRVTLTDSVTGENSTCTMLVDIDNTPTCTNVTAASNPAFADTLMGFDTTSASGNMQTATFEYSLDGGVTYVPATDSGAGALTGNPTAPFAGGAGQSWTWMTASDIPGDAFGVVFRVTVADVVTGETTTCQLVLDVLNAPSCVITPPMGLVSGDVLMAFTTTNPTGNPVDLAFDYSLNGGLSFTAAVEGAVPGTVTGNPAAGVAAGAGDWSWDTAAAVPGALASVVFRVTLTDSVTGENSTCTMLVDIDNTPTCTNVTAASSPAFADTLMSFDTTSPTGNMQTATFEYSVDGGVTYVPATDSGAGALTGNPTAPFAAGAGQSWSWMTASDIPGDAFGVVFRVTVADVVTGETTTCQLVLDVLNAPSCVITPPMGLVSGDVLMAFTTTNPTGNPVDLAFDYSLNGGLSFTAAVEGAVPGTVTGNPAAGVAAGAGDWSWDTAAAVPGALASVVFRVTLTDSVTGENSTCTMLVDIDNTPTCANVTAASSPAFADTLMSFDTTSPTGNMQTATFEYSVDGGVTYVPATDSGAGALTGNPTAPFAAGAGQSWSWMTASDIPGDAFGVVFRVTVADVVTGETTTCQLVLDVLNAPSCVITPPMGLPVAGDTLMAFTTTNPAGNPVDLAFDYSLNGGLSFAAAVEGAVPGTVTGNPAAGVAAGAGDWSWDTAAAVPGALASVVFRVTLTDSVTGENSTCTMLVDIDNTPTCAITNPAAATVLGADELISFTTTSPTGNPLDLTFEFSTDAGLTFTLAVEGAVPGTVTGNPAVGVAAGPRTWRWNTDADLPGVFTGVLFRLTTIDSVTGEQSTCERLFDADNQPTCNITLVIGGSPVAGNTQFQFTPTNPGGNMVTAAFEYSTDGGVTFNPATDSGGGVLMGNPTAPFNPMPNRSWSWDSGVDVPGSSASTIFRITITDATSPAASTCQVVVDVANSPSCNVTLPAAGSLVASDTLFQFNPTSPTGNQLSALFEFTTNGGLTYTTATEGAPPGNLIGNPTAAFAAVANRSWRWASQVDVPASANGVGFRITLTDVGLDGMPGTADDGGTGTCERVIDVDNRPSCTQVLAFPDPAIADTLMEFDPASPSGNDLIASFDFSIDGGLTFNVATEGAPVGNLTGNPTAEFTAVVNRSWRWDTGADLLAMPLTNVVFRITVTDVGPDGMAGTGDDAASSSCQIVLDVDNTPTCSVTSALPDPASGDTLMEFATVSPSGNMLFASFSYSTNSGVSFAAATDSGAGGLTGNPTAPFVAAIMNTWTWRTTLDVPADLSSAIWRVMITDAGADELAGTGDDGASSTCDLVVDVDNAPECTIAAFVGVQSGNVDVAITGIDPLAAATATALIEFSTDSGVTWAPAVEGAPAGGITGNPTNGFTGMQLWTWDTQASIGDASSVLVRATYDNGVAQSTCQASLDIANTPSCSFSFPLGGQFGGSVAMVVDYSDPSTDLITATFTYSVDGGVTFALATDAGGGVIMGNPAGPFAPALGIDWVWDTLADVPGIVSSVVFSVLVDDGFGNTSTCQTVLDVDNNTDPSCSAAPTIMGGATGGEVVVDFTTTDPDAGATLSVLVEYSTDGIVWNAISVGTCGGGMTSNPQVGLAPGATSICWDTGADIPDSSVTVSLRITLDDGFSGPVTTGCVTPMLTIDNTPTCSINAPASGTLLSGTSAINYSVDDPDGNLLLLNFLFSSDGGVSFNAAAAGSGSNPAFVIPPSTTDFDWDTVADIPGSAVGVIFRFTTYDGTTVTTCDEVFDVTNNTPPSCVINLPLPGAMLMGLTTVDFDLTDAEADPLLVIFEYSVNGGVTFFPATPHFTSLFANPAAGVAPAAGLTFIWNTPVDLPGGPHMVNIQIRVDDGQATGSCDPGATITIDNRPMPTCMIASPGAGAMVMLDQNFVMATSSPSGNLLAATLEYDAGGGFMPATDAGTGTLTGNPTMSFAAGVTDWTWDSLADIPGIAAGTVFRITLTDTGPDGILGTGDDGASASCSVAVDVDNGPACTINAPMPAAMVTGVVSIDFDASAVSGNMLEATFEFDAGGGFMLATDAGSGALVGNPTVPVFAGAAGLTWHWNSAADIAPLIMGVVFRITVLDVGLDGIPGTGDDGATSTCSVTVDVDNSPTCTINLPVPPGPVGGDIVINFDSTSATGNMLAAAFDYDTGGGAMVATDSGAGALLGNPTAPFVAAVGLTWTWDSDMDIPTFAPGTTLTVTVTDVGADGVLGTGDDGGATVCAVVIDIENRPSCTIASPMAGATVSGTVPLMFTATAPSGNMVTAVFEYDAGGGFMPATDAGTGTLTGNPTAAFAAGGTDWDWNSVADVPMGSMGVVLRITLTDTVTMTMSTCTVTVDVNQAPTCTITAPAMGAMVAGDATITFTTTSATGNLQQLSFEYDAGGGFMPATDAGGGTVTGNPTVPVAAGAGTWQWNSDADIPTMFMPTTFRITVLDVGLDGLAGTGDDGPMSTCAVMNLDVNNTPTCTITAPMAGAMVMGNQLISFTTTSPSGNTVMMDFEYSTGGPFVMATDAGGGTLIGNPTACVAAGAVTWEWDSAADVPMMAMTTFRVTVTDCVTGAFSQCTVMLDVQNGAPMCLTDCHWMREVMAGEGFDFGSPTAATLMGAGVSGGIQNTTGDGDEFCVPPAGAFGTCMLGASAPGHEPPCAPLTGTTAAGCGSFFSDAPDNMYKVVIPAGITMLTANTCTANTLMDTVIVFYDCMGVEAACFDPAGCGLGGGGGDTGTIPVVAGETWYILIEGFQGTSIGQYELIITGT